MSRKETMLCHERVRDLFAYDAADGRLVWRKKISPFSSVPVGAVAGTLMTDSGYRCVRIDRTGFYEHRLIWFWHYGAWPTPEIDHINGQRSDNRIENLRVATRYQNARNTKHHRSNKTGARGVIFIRATGLYRASIGVDGRVIQIGHFKTLDAASSAYREAQALHHGEFQRGAQL